MKKSKKNSAIIVLIVLLLALAIGYAAFQTVLTINGTATGDFTWDVHFTDATKFYEVTPAGAKGDAILNTARAEITGFNTKSTTGQNQTQTLTATVKLDYPGDAVILEAVILNGGSQPAKLTGFTVPGTQNGLIVSNPTITSGDSGEVLNPGKTCTVQFLVKWAPTSAVIGTSGNTQTFDIVFTYSQDTTEKSFDTTHTHQT